MGALRRLRARRFDQRAERRLRVLLVVLRVLVLGVAVYGLVHCPSWIEERYRATVVYRNASLCPAGHEPGDTADDCIERTTARVVDMGTSRSCTTDSNGLQSCTTYYSLDVRHARGTVSLDVEEETYDDVDRGDRADLRLWDGAVVRMEVAGHTEKYLAPAESSLLWRLAGTWLLLGAALTALVFPRSFLPFFAGGWLLLTLSAVGVTYGVLFGVSGFWEWLLYAAFGVPGFWCLVGGWRATGFR
ncbi:hypothetical protein ACIBVL_37230 [Streptomyces sp. NPDC049687]|uniref:hypothetical protein n=1 Tax=Streptomyces sp. NPDC049687 TaxID=3365596 RepID=UPI00378F2A75